MWPPSNGRIGSRLMMPRFTLRKASRTGYQCCFTACRLTSTMPTGPTAPFGPVALILPLIEPPEAVEGAEDHVLGAGDAEPRGLPRRGPLRVDAGVHSQAAVVRSASSCGERHRDGLLGLALAADGRRAVRQRIVSFGCARRVSAAPRPSGPALAVGADERVAALAGRRSRPACRCTTLSSVLLAVDDALDADEQHEDDGRGGEVHERARGDGHVALPDRLLVVDAVAGIVGHLFFGRHAADLAEAAQRDDADAVLGLAPGAPQGGRRKAHVELLDAHAERLGGEEVPELVHRDEQAPDRGCRRR